MVRHGYGIQLFGRNENDTLCHYVGQWERDKKHGQGKFVHPDGSSYEGQYFEDKFQGEGTFIRSQSASFPLYPDWYKGAWRDGKMEGQGEFINNS